jgi:hypothetical protein|tara:strand:- start:3276 stop:3590 length:315 start_codon:yes stop_codon:yes gene_type:complete
MLINEVMSEGQDYVLNGVEELIVRAKARGLTKLNTPAMLAKLEAGGYFIDMKSLVRLLNTINAVGSANKEEIKLDTALPPGADPRDDTVSKMASKQLTKKDKKL